MLTSTCNGVYEPNDDANLTCRYHETGTLFRRVLRRKLLHMQSDPSGRLLQPQDQESCAMDHVG